MKVNKLDLLTEIEKAEVRSLYKGYKTQATAIDCFSCYETYEGNNTDQYTNRHERVDEPA